MLHARGSHYFQGFLLLGCRSFILPTILMVAVNFVLSCRSTSTTDLANSLTFLNNPVIPAPPNRNEYSEDWTVPESWDSQERWKPKYFYRAENKTESGSGAAAELNSVASQIPRKVPEETGYAVMYSSVGKQPSELGGDRTANKGSELNLNRSVLPTEKDHFFSHRKNSHPRAEEENLQKHQENRYPKTVPGIHVDRKPMVRNLRIAGRRSRIVMDEPPRLKTSTDVDELEEQTEILGGAEGVSERFLKLATRAYDKNDSFGSMSEVTRNVATPPVPNYEATGRSESRRVERISSSVEGSRSLPLGDGVLFDEDYKVGITDSPEIDAVFADLLLEKGKAKKLTEAVQAETSGVDIFKPRWDRRRRNTRSERRRAGRGDSTQSRKNYPRN